MPSAQAEEKESDEDAAGDNVRRIDSSALPGAAVPGESQCRTSGASRVLIVPIACVRFMDRADRVVDRAFHPPSLVRHFQGARRRVRRLRHAGEDSSFGPTAAGDLGHDQNIVDAGDGARAMRHHHRNPAAGANAEDARVRASSPSASSWNWARRARPGMDRGRERARARHAAPGRGQRAAMLAILVS